MEDEMVMGDGDGTGDRGSGEEDRSVGVDVRRCGWR